MLSIGVVEGGPEVSATCTGKLVSKLMRIASEERGDFTVGSWAAVNLVFHIPGSMLQDLDYEGLRDGAFSRKQKLLMIQVAVPGTIAVTQDEEQVCEFLLDSLLKANDLAAKYFKKKGIEYSQPKFLGLVDSIKRRLLEP